MKTKDEKVPTAVAMRAIGAGLLAMVVMGLLTDKFLHWGLWSSFIGGVAWAVVFVGMVRLMMGRVPLRPWARRMLGREE
ncbi:MAG: hypothetical protein WCB86_11370 [Candidatus Dormiibacterota bacterium]